MSAPPLRALPSVDRVAAALDAPHALAVTAARRAIAAAREELRTRADGAGLRAGAGADDVVEELVQRTVELARRELAALTRPSLRPVLNATGVILHTNLGRAPLAAPARDAVARAAAGYANLELDLESGRRGSRQAHVGALLAQLTGAEAGLAVNNGAGAALLAVAATAGPGGTVVVSRGQAIEIGGGFRIPEVVAQAGAELVEVGTTNRTRLADYERALAAAPGATVLRVHPSNFRALGFVESVEIEALCGLGAPVVDDLGSGALAQEIPALADEPDVRRSLQAGAALVTFSGDKLLGGPQAGLLVGSAAAVSSAAAHPLARALRIDKLSLAALEATLSLYRDPALARREIPVLAMLDSEPAALAARAELIADTVGAHASVIQSSAKVGGGALPLLELAGPAVAVDPGPAGADALAAALRSGEPAVIARIADGRLVLDPRTLTDAEASEAAQLVARALGAGY